jgi:hypothetical protein
MQLAAFLDKELQSKGRRKSFTQKGKQILEAWELEKSWSKEEILELISTLSHSAESFKEFLRPQGGSLERIPMVWSGQNLSSSPRSFGPPMPR